MSYKPQPLTTLLLIKQSLQLSNERRSVRTLALRPLMDMEAILAPLYAATKFIAHRRQVLLISAAEVKAGRAYHLLEAVFRERKEFLALHFPTRHLMEIRTEELPDIHVASTRHSSLLEIRQKSRRFLLDFLVLGWHQSLEFCVRVRPRFRK